MTASDVVIQMTSLGWSGSSSLGRFRLSVTGDTEAVTRAELRMDLKDSELVDLNVAMAKAHARQGQISEALTSFADALALAGDRAAKARIITEAAPLEGMLEKLAERAAADAPFQAELARHFAERGDRALADAARTRARASIDAKLAKEPENSALAADLADLLLSDTTPWRVLKPTEMKSEKGATLTLEGDGSILASGINADGDVYKISAVANLDHVAAVRLETLPDASLPNNGPGRHVSGNFHLRAFRLYQPTGDGKNGFRPLPIGRAWASYEWKAPDEDIAGTVDQSLNKFWHVWGRLGDAHQAIFKLKEAAPSKNRPIVVELRHFYNLGRFRLSVSEDPAALEREEKRFGAMKVSDPWAKLAAAYYIIADQKAFDSIVKAHPAAAAGIGDLHAADKKWEGAIAAYSKLITDQTTDGNVVAKRALAYEATERWALAAADWLRAAKQQPELAQSAYDGCVRAQRWKEASQLGLVLIERNSGDSLTWLQVAPVLVLAGDDAAYAAFCRRFVDQFAATQPTEDAERVVKACVLRSKVIALAKLPGAKLAKSLEDGAGAEWFPQWGWGTRALLACRSGDGAAALEYLKKSEEHKPTEFCHVLNLVVRAIAQHQLQRPEEARRALDEASQLIDRLQADDKNKGDHDLLIARILQREAEGQIKGKAKP